MQKLTLGLTTATLLTGCMAVPATQTQCQTTNWTMMETEFVYQLLTSDVTQQSMITRGDLTKQQEKLLKEAIHTSGTELFNDKQF